MHVFGVQRYGSTIACEIENGMGVGGWYGAEG